MFPVFSRGGHVEWVLRGGEVTGLEVRGVALVVDCTHQEHVAGGSGQAGEDTGAAVVMKTLTNLGFSTIFYMMRR